MGRKERRAALKAQQIMNRRDELALSKRKQWRDEQTIDEALKETVDMTTYQVSGEIYTMFALVMRQAPYRWNTAKIMRLFERVQSGTAMLIDGTYTVDQLIEDAEAWGFRLKWGVVKGSRKYINEIHAFEEEVEADAR